jgi:hypothetical protein
MLKIRQSDVRRFLQIADRMWKSMRGDGSPTVVFAFTERSYSIAMVEGGLLLTYLCNRVNGDMGEQVLAVPMELSRDCSTGSGIVDLEEAVEEGECYIEAKWTDGFVFYERRYSERIPPADHLIPDLAWHTVDERMLQSGLDRDGLSVIGLERLIIARTLEPTH